MLLAYVALVPDELFNWARATSFELAERYGGNPSPFEPHITLKGPFEADDVEPHVRYLDTLARETPVLDVTVGGWIFWNGGYVVLDVTPQEPLHDVQQRILRDLELTAVEFEGPAYHFHLTLLVDVVGRARMELGESPSWTFPIERFALARKSAEGWLAYRISSR